MTENAAPDYAPMFAALCVEVGFCLHPKGEKRVLEALPNGLDAAVRAVFEAHGRTVALNRPYAGGYVTQTWARPKEGFHALQIEIDRSLYLDEETLEPHAGFAPLKAEVERIAEALIDLAAPRADAAE